jgi:hypothetical protein
MRTYRLLLSVCFLTVLACGTASAQDNLSFSVSTVTEGSSTTVTVTSAPDASVTVEFIIVGLSTHTVTCGVPGQATFEVPPGTAGKRWRVLVSSGNHQDEEAGWIAPAPVPPSDV